MTSIAFIGMGAMGARMAARLLGAGHDLTVYNRTRERTAPLAEAGAAVAESPADAARAAELVITMLTDPAALRTVTDAEDGIAAGIGPDATLVEMSTVGPEEIARLAAAMPEGVGVLDAPVLGSIGEADAGTLRLFVGGPEALVRRHTPVLEVMGTVLHAGGLGAGAAAKLVANSTLFGILGVLGESVALAEGLGLSDAVTREVLAATPIGAQAERRAAILEGHEVDEVRFALSLARKDSELVLAAAERAGVDVRLAAAARSWLADAEAAGMGAGDYSQVLQAITGRRPGTRGARGFRR
jgi:3-hydroxyisobutyrate dehydrogenase-like beta-hydroxyacid dehydrogenase